MVASDFSTLSLRPINAFRLESVFATDFILVDCGCILGDVSGEALVLDKAKMMKNQRRNDANVLSCYFPIVTCFKLQLYNMDFFCSSACGEQRICVIIKIILV